MVNALAPIAVAQLPLAPKNPLPYRRRLWAIRNYNVGLEMLRDAGGTVTRLRLAPRWLMPEFVVATSPQGIRDVLSRNDGLIDKMNPVYDEMRALIGDNLFDLPRADWLPRRRALQPVFTKKHVHQFAGHMAGAAEMVASQWTADAQVDLDYVMRRLTLRALGRSVLGRDLDRDAEVVGDALLVALQHINNRATSPVKLPGWLPTAERRRAKAASRTLRRLTGEILAACRADPDHEAPLVQALIAATDSDSGLGLTDSEICDELIVFLLAGHDTTATTLTYALWALGCHPEIQQRVADEVAALGDRELTPDDMPRLGYTVQVLHEALRLCPPGPGGTRMAMGDVEVDGYRVPAGTMLIFGIIAVHRDPALWKDPLRFDPDRFSPEQAKGRDRWHYLPFGAGARSCIGDHFAMLEATLALATIIRRVQIRSAERDFPVALPFTMVADGPINAHLTPR
jgi:cytochrome P450